MDGPVPASRTEAHMDTQHARITHTDFSRIKANMFLRHSKVLSVCVHEGQRIEDLYFNAMKVIHKLLQACLLQPPERVLGDWLGRELS